jgi:hypothetical protein
MRVNKKKCWNLVRLDPSTVELVEPLQVDDEDGRQPPDLKLLGGQLQILNECVSAVVYTKN